MQLGGVIWRVAPVLDEPTDRAFGVLLPGRRGALAGKPAEKPREEQGLVRCTHAIDTRFSRPTRSRRSSASTARRIATPSRAVHRVPAGRSADDLPDDHPSAWQELIPVDHLLAEWGEGQSRLSIVR
jgi:hypothetical protein